MSARRIVGYTSLALFALCLFWLAPLHAQLDAPLQPEIENSKYQFTGVINANAVYIRSGPSENDYPTLKLDKGAEVVVTGVKFDWLKVVPPEGSFCYVAKLYVDRRGNGSVGRVTSTLNVRIGSQLNELKAKIGTKLEPGADVEIIGEDQEYFKIRPPQDVYFYVNKQFVDPVRPVNLAQNDPQVDRMGAARDEVSRNELPDYRQPVEDENALAGDVEVTRTPEIGGNEPLALPRNLAEAAPRPATQPSAAAADAEAEFDRLEDRYAEITLQPLIEQPVTELLEGYQKLSASDALPESLRRIAEFKVEVLKARLEVQQQFADTRRHLDEMNQRQMALHAERDELEQRIKENDVQFYTAVGTLRPSSLQQGSATLYRLTDPANGRTVVYVRTNDTQIAGMIGQFVGIRGEVQTDRQLNLRVITPTSFEPVNPAKVGQSIAAQIAPPSLLPGSGTARVE